MQKDGAFFITFYAFKSGQRGQVAAFLIAIMVVALVAAVALIEIAKVSQYKLSTANAADAAALAGASNLASTANMIARMNEELYLSYMGQLIACTFVPLPIAYETGRFYLYLTSGIFNLLAYINLLIAGHDAIYSARASAHQFALNNAGIEEAQVYSRSGPVEQPYSKRIKDVDFSKKDSFTYDWQEYPFNPVTGKRTELMGEAGRNSVTSKVDLGTQAMVLRPMPAGLLYGVYYAPCGSGWILTEAQKVQAKYVFSTILLAAGVLNGLDNNLDSILLGLIALVHQVPLVYLWTISPCWEPVHHELIIVFYIFPVPYILGINNLSQLNISSTVTRHSPEKNLGLWKIKAEDVTSTSKAGVHTAGVSQCPSRGGWTYQMPCYDLKLE
jgi:hypothetical protein